MFNPRIIPFPMSSKCEARLSQLIPTNSNDPIGEQVDYSILKRYRKYLSIGQLLVKKPEAAEFVLKTCRKLVENADKPVRKRKKKVKTNLKAMELLTLLNQLDPQQLGELRNLVDKKAKKKLSSNDGDRSNFESLQKAGKIKTGMKNVKKWKSSKVPIQSSSAESDVLSNEPVVESSHKTLNWGINQMGQKFSWETDRPEVHNYWLRDSDFKE